MGIKLDWQIEAERAYQRAGEDPVERSRRRQVRLRILFFTAMVIGWVCVIGALIWYRLYTVDTQLRQSLVNTVQAETAALRIGDLAGFISIQRSANKEWEDQQTNEYQKYQKLKTEHDLNLTGIVVDATIEQSRGRALVEEVIDGVTYRTVWFYWHYSDGWRHVPSDYTFWGEASTIAGKVSTVKFYQFDAPYAQLLSTRLDRWWAEGCGYLGCQEIPKLTIQIVPDPYVQIHWDTPNTLVLPSPLASNIRVPANMALSETLENEIAAQMADHLFDIATANLKPIPRTDVDWLRQATIDWLAATFTGRGDPAHLGFMQSLKDHYGTQGLVALIRALSPSSDVSIVGTALNQPLESLALDWSSFFQWRLDVEKTALNQGDIERFQSLWDTANPDALMQMNQRMSRPTQATPQVQAVTIGPGPDGIPRANVQATTPDGNLQTIVFRLVNGAWKRSA